MESVSLTSICSARICSSFCNVRWSKVSRSSFSNALSTYTWHLLSRGVITSKLGFSVVAPMSVIVPSSTAPSRLSCCDLEKRCISSMNRIGHLLSLGAKSPLFMAALCLAFSITSLTSFTPLVTALSV